MNDNVTEEEIFTKGLVVQFKDRDWIAKEAGVFPMEIVQRTAGCQQTSVTLRLTRQELRKLATAIVQHELELDGYYKRKRLHRKKK